MDLSQKQDPTGAIREGVIERIVNLCRARNGMRNAIACIEDAGAAAHEVWKGWPEPMASKAKPIDAVCLLADVVCDGLNDDVMDAARQLAMLVARDVIAPHARSADVPVVALTGNSYMPPIRDISEVESVWQADDSGDVFSHFIECLESALDQEDIIMGTPDYDNMLYVVDTRRWYLTGNNDGDDPNYWLDNANYSALRD